jgi:H+-transporting ATPase
MCTLVTEARSKADTWINAQAAKGLRTLGVASRAGDGAW